MHSKKICLCFRVKHNNIEIETIGVDFSLLWFESVVWLEFDSTGVPPNHCSVSQWSCALVCLTAVCLLFTRSAANTALHTCKQRQHLLQTKHFVRQVAQMANHSQPHKPYKHCISMHFNNSPDRRITGLVCTLSVALLQWCCSAVLHSDSCRDYDELWASNRSHLSDKLVSRLSTLQSLHLFHSHWMHWSFLFI